MVIKHATLHAQRGISVSGLIFVLAVLAVMAMLGMKVFPTFLEYRAVKSGIAAAKSQSGTGTVREMQMTFDKNANINGFENVKGTDLMISKETGETQIAFAYSRTIPLFTNVSLVIDYSGTTDPKGVIPEKPTEPAR